MVESTHFPTSIYGPIVGYVVPSCSNNVTMVLLMRTLYYYLANHKQIHFLYVSHVMHSQRLATIHGLDLGIAIIISLGIYFVSLLSSLHQSGKSLSIEHFQFYHKIMPQSFK
jgi:hypothetical protein